MSFDRDKKMEQNLTTGSITGKLLLFAVPLMIGNVLQQFYNVVDTWVVGKYIGSEALAAVGSAYTLMTFLTSVILGLCMGSSAYFAIQYGRNHMDSLKKGIFLSFSMIGVLSLVITGIVLWQVGNIIRILRVPAEIADISKDYLVIIFFGIMATFLYNYYANLLRAVGNSVVPLIFLAVSVILNVILDIYFVVSLGWGVKGAALATVIAQYVSATGLFVFYSIGFSQLKMDWSHMVWDMSILKDIFRLSGLTCLQQSVMNFGILMVQGLVNSFGSVVMAAFSVAVKIDTIAYMPVQDYGNAFSTFVAQNYGAGKTERIKKGVKSSVIVVFIFCIIISSAVCVFAPQLMNIFVKGKPDVTSVGVSYLRIEAAFYFGIGLLFMLYGFYRGINRPAISLVLTVCSLGTRVLLAYVLSAIPAIGVKGIWVSIPIGWILADAVWVIYYMRSVKKHNGTVDNLTKL